MNRRLPGPDIDPADLPYEGTEAFPGRDTYALQKEGEFDGDRQAAQGGAASYRTAEPWGDGEGEQSLGELLSRLSNDATALMRSEIELAKVELKEEAAKAGKAGGMLGGAAILGYLTLTLLAFAAAWGLDAVMPAGLAFLIVGVVVGAVAAVLALVGRKTLQQVSPVPNQTIETLKEDARWARAQVT